MPCRWCRICAGRILRLATRAFQAESRPYSAWTRFIAVNCSYVRGAKGLEPLLDQAKWQFPCGSAPYRFVSVPVITHGFVSALDYARAAESHTRRSDGA